MSPPRNSVRRGRELHDTRHTTAVSQTQPTGGRLGAGEDITRAAVLTFITKQATYFFIVNNA